ncbi:MAG: phytanoyl-CoA dioxygenase family protein [Alphaproteobacteria bacterium]|nr:phytanoyl-CoA dioxygenase family protein [Alphaproteobacteria bacterium]
MRLGADDLARYRAAGHLTVPGVFAPAEMDAAIADLETWGEEFLRELDPAQRRWYVDGGVKARDVLRKLDQPVFFRPAIRRLACDPRLVEMVEQVLGRGVAVHFSQVFFKPPEGGGPKPMHQDNAYFGPSDPDGLITAWIALDDAGAENGCMEFGEGSHLRPLHAHAAPADEPFNLQVPEAATAGQAMTLAPVPKGGVSFHHGATLHRSGANRSSKWRRACAVHYVRHDVDFVRPAWAFDATKRVAVSRAP